MEILERSPQFRAAVEAAARANENRPAEERLLELLDRRKTAAIEADLRDWRPKPRHFPFWKIVCVDGAVFSHPTMEWAGIQHREDAVSHCWDERHQIVSVTDPDGMDRTEEIACEFLQDDIDRCDGPDDDVDGAARYAFDPDHDVQALLEASPMYRHIGERQIARELVAHFVGEG